MRITVSVNDKPVPPVDRLCRWLRVYFTLWHPALMLFLCGRFLWIYGVDRSTVLMDKMVDGARIVVTQNLDHWSTFDRIMIFAVIACIWFYVSNYIPRWWKIVRRMNYNRVSRIG